ncbi:3-beta hydroxysteroid dehydrogenase [Kaistia algarum]|uniref:SDR family oxidoreductase n=1 Tax=Kaistia algarum TaxID=2083279 RepID=UPI000CE75488|nr:SDR family oxidoreductase [Kaistia algarum]MCX5514613.1 SDR family oxidoreductase [Kaistia algarum]PPE78946.1 3-beta hydroxysteroid dehydrogenase [Kaistia algarum]
MRVFVTGASGWVGSAVVQELLGAGHDVLGLVRTEAAAQKLAAIGAEARLGSLEDIDSLRRGAGEAEGVIHTAFNHDFSKFAENCELDRRAIEALGAELAGTDRPLLVTSGLALLAQGRLATEADAAVPPSARYARASEATAIALANQGVRAATVRLPPSVHGHGDQGFVPILIRLAREKGVSAYIGEGENHWPAVHRLDAAAVFRRAIERGAKEGPYHAIAEEGVPFRDIAALIGRRLNLPVVSKSLEEVAGHFGWFANFAAMDVRASSRLTREKLGWAPTQPGLLTDLDHPSYFSV